MLVGGHKLLQIRDFVKLFFWTQIGNGKNVSIWIDGWCDHCPLIRYLSPRDLSREGYSLKSTVSDLVSNEGWRWPQSWLLKAPILGQIPTPSIDDNKADTQFWCNFTHQIPRHAFHLWLVMRNSLKTQDKLRQWDVGDGTDLSTLRMCVL
ncbi:hypothetical protein Tco_0566274 [Tanacetum coccineum]